MTWKSSSLMLFLLSVIGFFFFELKELNLSEIKSEDNTCQNKFAYGQPKAIQENTTFLCRSGYAVLHDDKKRVPLYSAERLNGLNLKKDIMRTNNFQSDPHLPSGSRAELNDYSHSGYDRGHMAPAADAASDQAMDESFYLSNIIPQNNELNMGLWADLEKATRACAQSVGEVFVLTGPVFGKSQRTIGQNRVRVPEHLYKIVLDVQSSNSRAFLVPNHKIARTRNLSRYQVPIVEVERRTKLKFFPQVGALSTTSLNTTLKGTLCPEFYGR